MSASPSRIWTIFSPLLICLIFSTRPTRSLSSAGPSGLAPSFSPSERLEQDRAWKAIRKNCIGCWSGKINSSIYDEKRGTLLPKPNSPLLNFRVEARLLDDPDVGMWTVWNRRELGDVARFPLSRIPTGPTQFRKVAFDKVLVRISEAEDRYFELGFWEKDMRRTVIHYNDVESSGRRWRWLPWGGRNIQLFNRFSVLQQRREDANGFVGNYTDEKALQIMPDSPPFQINELKLAEMTAVSCETVDLATMQRRAVSLDENGAQEACQLALEDCFKETAFPTKVLLNAIFVSIPKRMRRRGTNCLLFGHQWDNGDLQVLAMDYDGKKKKALKVTNYLFRRRITC